MIRQIAGESESIFLTFDDGPDGIQTEAVLDVLRSANVTATFFLIGEKIADQKTLVRRMVDEGHSLGNHSWDHKYRNYFAGEERLRSWISRTNQECARLNLAVPIGFRPPAGVVTPPLVAALRKLHEPLVLWNTRFYDAVLPWTLVKAEAAARKVSSGSIILLHDRQPSYRSREFCEALAKFISIVQSRGLKFSGLRREHLDH